MTKQLVGTVIQAFQEPEGTYYPLVISPVEMISYQAMKDIEEIQMHITK